MSRRDVALFAAAAVVGITLMAWPSPAHADPTVETPLPADGVVSIERTSATDWLATFDVAPWEFKVIGNPQLIVCGSNYGKPCTIHVAFSWPAGDCMYAQVDWSGGAHNSSDPYVCRPLVTATPTTPPTVPPTASPSPTPTVTATATPTPGPTHTFVKECPWNKHWADGKYGKVCALNETASPTTGPQPTPTPSFTLGIPPHVDEPSDELAATGGREAVRALMLVVMAFSVIIGAGMLIHSRLGARR